MQLHKLLLPAAMLSLATTSSAATVGYWRFEDTPGFLNDSALTPHNLSTEGTAPTQTAIPGTGNGSDFPATIPQTSASNAKFATLGGAGNFSVADPFAVSDFTLEAFVNKTANTTNTQYIISQWNTGTFQRSYALGFGGTTGGISNNKLFMTLSDLGTDSTVFQSSFTIVNDRDYFVAVSFDESNLTSGITFYLQDLTNSGTLQSQSIAHTITSLHNSTANFEIGSYSAGSSRNRFNGLIDEVRVSDAVLTESQLMNVIPEPGTLALLGLSGLALLFSAGRKRKI